jgi:hypothetical protein
MDLNVEKFDQTQSFEPEDSPSPKISNVHSKKQLSNVSFRSNPNLAVIAKPRKLHSKHYTDLSVTSLRISQQIAPKFQHSLILKDRLNSFSVKPKNLDSSGINKSK